MTEPARAAAPLAASASPSWFACDLHVVAAFPPELAALRRAFGGQARHTVATAGGPVTVELAAVGIGLVASGLGAQSLLAARPARAVVLVGTCGAYAAGGLGVLDVAVGTAVALIDPAVAEGRAAFPGPMAADRATDGALAAGLMAAGGRSARIATTLAVTTDDGLAARMADASRCEVEHLEAYAVALACAAAGATFGVALAVANAVGNTGREEWRAHHVDASERAAQVVLAWLGAGAPGVPRL